MRPNLDPRHGAPAHRQQLADHARAFLGMHEPVQLATYVDCVVAGLSQAAAVANAKADPRTVQAVAYGRPVPFNLAAGIERPVQAAAKKDAPPPALEIHDEIGGPGIKAESFIRLVNAHRGEKSLLVTMNSPGGSVFDGLAIANALRSLSAAGTKTTVRVLGIAASIASVIACAADTVEMAEGSFMFVHNAWAGVIGDAEDLREHADLLDKVDASIVGTYVAKTGLPEKRVRSLMEADTLMSADEAVRDHFADRVWHGADKSKAQAAIRGDAKVLLAPKHAALLASLKRKGVRLTA